MISKFAQPFHRISNYRFGTLYFRHYEVGRTPSPCGCMGTEQSEGKKRHLCSASPSPAARSVDAPSFDGVKKTTVPHPGTSEKLLGREGDLSNIWCVLLSILSQTLIKTGWASTAMSTRLADHKRRHETIEDTDAATASVSLRPRSQRHGEIHTWSIPGTGLRGFAVAWVRDTFTGGERF